ncbi:GtrA family protein [Pulveribacter sp.]|uniref:GtrA family protein n=1 Tax=Pulveribacter sp. TaxID=2678893 RepID=UPI0028B14F25|nr:GtrA family protein [Pulveribacter sp.]
MKSAKKANLARGLRFIVGGGANTAFSYVIYLLLKTTMPYQWAYLIAYTMGIVFAYWVNARWVFRVPLSWRGLLSYPIVYVVQYLISALLLGVLVEVLGINVTFAPIFVVVASLPLTYLMNRFVLNSGIKEKGRKNHDSTNVVDAEPRS